MRRQSLFIAVLLCALILSGWGGVLAAVLCPHAAQMAAAPLKTKGHASCHAKADASDDESPAAAASHKSMDDMEASSRTKEESRDAAARSTESCRHCISHRSLPTEPVKARDAQPGRGDTGVVDSPPVRSIAPPAFIRISNIIPTQGSPPGRGARRHLLLGIFLI
ncbi:MAG TPA: hypothetical protein VE842_18995 [Pyrinomonadaceae bacterium]|jgi:hypothetical protein|nr:hypothetical protein [Pyrinomonadaceae bacterium]